MANKTIPQLPEQTGKTDDDLLVIVDSGETTTSKIKVSTLLDGVGGVFISADGTNNVVPDYYTTSAIDSGSSESAIIGGTGNNVNGTSRRSVIAGGENNDVNSTNNFIGGGVGNSLNSANAASIGGTNNTVNGQNSASLGGGFYNINANWSIIAGGNTHTISQQHSTILGGTGHNISGERSSIMGGQSNTLTHNRSVILGGSGLTTNYDDEVVCEHLTTSGQSRGNFYNNLSGDTFTIDWDEGNLQKIYMTGDTSLTFSNVKNGATYKLQIENGGTHSITGVTASGFTILCEGGSIPNITNNGVDLCVLEVMDTDILVRHFANFSTP